MESKTKEPDILDWIAEDLPVEVRAGFYRVMRHCRSLPESDEMLVVIKAMGYLALLTERAPRQVKEERERLDGMLGETKTSIRQLAEACVLHHKELDQRLTQLPADIARGVSPEAIVGQINENLRQQFVRSTIPITAAALSATAEDMKATTAEYQKTSTSLRDSCQAAAREARQAISDIRTSVVDARKSATETSRAMATSIDRTYRWVLWGIGLTAFFAGVMVCFLVFDHFRPYRKTVYEIPPELQLMMERRAMEEQLIPQRRR